MIIKTINCHISKNLTLVQEDFQFLLDNEYFKGYKNNNNYHFVCESLWTRLKPKIICSLYDNNDYTNIQIQVIVSFFDLSIMICFFVLSVYGLYNIIPTFGRFPMILDFFILVLFLYIGLFHIIQYRYFTKKLLNNMNAYIIGEYDKIINKEK